MKILLTGASGFVGRYLLRLLERAEVHALTRNVGALPEDLRKLPNVRWHEVNLANETAVSKLVQELRPERCVHLAWDTLPGRYLDDKEGNLRLLDESLHLYRELIQTECEQIVTLGTCAEYAMNGELLTAQSAMGPQTIYAAAKSSLALLGSQLCKGTATAFCWARLFYVYGPGEHPKRLVSGLLKTLLDGGEFACGAGTKKKDYLYIRDVAAGIKVLLHSKAEGFFNLSSGLGVTIADIGAAAESAVGTQGKVRYGALPERPWDPDFVVGDNLDLLRLGWRPAFDLQSGLRDYVETLRKER